MTHVHKEFDGQRVGKRYRIPLRVLIAIVIICLGFAKFLSSLQLISTSTGLVVFVLIVDLYGSTSIHDTFWRCTAQCKYSAECALKRKVILNALKNGKTVKISEANNAQLDEKGFLEVA